MASAPTIQPLTAETLPKAAGVLVEAFMTDPLFVFLIPDSGQRRRWLPFLMKSLVGYAAPRAESRLATDEQGKVLGACIAGRYPPSAWEEAMLNLRVTFRPSPWEPKLGPFLRITQFSKIWKKMHWKSPHWYVYIIGIAPEHQGKGLGRALMLGLIGRATAAGLPVFLETQTESNVPFYRSLGFEVTEQHRPFPEGPGTWGMFRKL